MEDNLPRTKHQLSKSMNDIINQDHRKIKRITNHVQGFKHFKFGCSIIQDIEAMRTIRKGQAGTKSVTEEIKLTNIIFVLYKNNTYKG